MYHVKLLLKYTVNGTDFLRGIYLASRCRLFDECLSKGRELRQPDDRTPSAKLCMATQYIALSWIIWIAFNLII